MTPSRRSRPAPGRCASHQRGASLVMTVSFLMSAVLFMVLVIDTGRLYLEKRRVQRLADMAALDAANRGVLCGSVLASDLLALAQASVARNGYLGMLQAGQVQPGYINYANGERAFVASSSTVDAVQVTVTRTVPASLFAGGLFGGQATVGSTAVAQRPLLATIMAGTNLLTVNTASSPLVGPLLDTLFGKSNLNINLSVLSYQGMANAGITLRDFLGGSGLNLLTTDLSVGGINSALATNVSLAQVVNASINLLNSKSGTLGLGLNNLQTGIKNANLQLGDVIQVNSREALDAQVNVADVIMAAAYAANGSNALAIPISISIPGLTSIGLSLKVIEPPQIGYGKPGLNGGVPYTAARTAQIRVLATAGLNLSPLVGMNIGAGLGVADGLLWFKSGTCQTLSNPYSIVLNGNTAPLLAGVGDPVWMAANDAWKDDASILISHPASLDILGGLVRVTIAAVLPRMSASGKDATYVVSNRATDLPMTKTITSGLGSLAASLGGLAYTVNISLLGLTCPNILNPTCLLVPTVSSILSLVTPLVSSLITTVLDPLLTLLGINTDSMQATLINISDKGSRLVN